MEFATQPRPTTSAVAVRYGLLTGVVLIIYSFILLVSNQMANGALTSVIYLIMVGGIVLAQRAFRSGNDGFMSYGEGLGIGTLLSLVSGVLSSVFSFVYQTFMDPGSRERMADQMRAKLEEAGTMSDGQIDQLIATTQKFSTGPMSLATGILGAVIIGFILSLIVSAIMKRTRPEFE